MIFCDLIGHKSFKCGPNEARCGETAECRPIKLFCDKKYDCPDNSDEWSFCGKLILFNSDLI